jgi:aminoglycoside 6'-N-acetyltransferase I
VLRASDAHILANTVPGVFDNAVDPQLVVEFLNDPRHHIIVAIDASQVVGFISAVHYINPDKPAELWLNEVSVAPSHQNRGIGRQMLETMLSLGRELSCSCAWVLTDTQNTAAMRLYEAAGGVAEPKPSVLFEFPLKL